MKTIICLIGFLTLNVGAIHEMPIVDNKLQVEIHNDLTFEDMAKIKSDMAEKGITIDYQKLVFNESGKLRVIAFSVDCNDGFRGTAERPVPSKKKTPFGFFRDYTEGAKVPFAIGNLDVK